MNINIGGSISAVISPSTLRSDRRNARATRICRSLRVRWVSVIAGRPLPARRGLAGEGEEDVIETGADQLETVDQCPRGIELVEPCPDGASASVAGDAEAQRARVGADRQR